MTAGGTKQKAATAGKPAPAVKAAKASKPSKASKPTRSEACIARSRCSVACICPRRSSSSVPPAPRPLPPPTHPTSPPPWPLSPPAVIAVEGTDAVATGAATGALAVAVVAVEVVDEVEVEGGRGGMGLSQMWLRDSCARGDAVSCAIESRSIHRRTAMADSSRPTSAGPPAASSPPPPSGRPSPPCRFSSSMTSISSIWSRAFWGPPQSQRRRVLQEKGPREDAPGGVAWRAHGRGAGSGRGGWRRTNKGAAPPVWQCARRTTQPGASSRGPLERGRECPGAEKQW